MHSPFYLAPMAELSHRALRELIEIFGSCDEYFTEMISANALVQGGQFEAWYIDALPVPEKTVYQLLGSNSDILAKAVSILDKYDCAGIDINMGCSAPLITRSGAGVTLMADKDKAGDLMRVLRKRTEKRLSCKIRIGMEDDFDYLVSFCKRLEAEGLDLITLHPRTAKEKFKRLARWDYVRRLKSELAIPVAGNGDIASAQELLRKSDGSCSAIMIGRLAVRCPWVFAEARHIEKGGLWDASGINLEEISLRFLDLLTKYQPAEFHTSRAHRFFSCFCDNFTWGGHLKTLIGREKELSAVSGVLKSYFRENPEEKFEKSVRNR